MDADRPVVWGQISFSRIDRRRWHCNQPVGSAIMVGRPIAVTESPATGIE
ncbi:MAG TPA: hypothetical protein VGE97_06070 [Nitrososphaera sp.]